jgi:hypothetical protein
MATRQVGLKAILFVYDAIGAAAVTMRAVFSAACVFF